MQDIIEKLKGGDRRSIGRSEEVVLEVLKNLELFDALIQGILNDDPVVRMRAADAVEKVTIDKHFLLQPYKDLILDEISKIRQKEVRWHVAQLLPRLKLINDEDEKAVAILKEYMSDESRIVRTFAMDSLAYFAERDPTLETWVITLIEELVEDGSPALKSRGEKLLIKLKGVGKKD